VKELFEIVQKIDGKLDRLDGRLDSVDVTLAKQQVTLDEHVRRTNLLETQVKPLEHHITQMRTAFKVLAYVGSAGIALAGLMLTLKELLS
jgi:predicted  nucleic acid-binding Zn-ribbon protein